MFNTPEARLPGGCGIIFSWSEAGPRSRMPLLGTGGKAEGHRQKEIECMAEGTVKWFSEKKGYGFISQDDGNDVFVHYSSIAMSGFKKLAEGDRVNFEIDEDNRGPKAKNVQKL
jgi:CspA family cold shock protein